MQYSAYWLKQSAVRWSGMALHKAVSVFEKVTKLVIYVTQNKLCTRSLDANCEAPTSMCSTWKQLLTCI